MEQPSSRDRVLWLLIGASAPLPSTMHRCLQIAEILQNIFFFTSRSRSLYALALVSKTFHEPALDILWERHGSLLRLVKTFPVDVWKETGDPSTLFLQRALLASDFDRFRFYGRRIKKLWITMSYARRKMEPCRPQIDAGVFQAIACALDIFQFKGPLLPNLCEIYCEDGPGDTLWNVYPLLSSKLQVFTLHIKQPPGLATMTILSALRTKSTQIQTFNVEDGFFCGGELTPHISTFLCGLPHLRTLECAEVTLTHEAVLHLASLPNLHEVNIRVPHGEIDINLPPRTHFPALRRLTLNCDLLTHGIKFVKSIIRGASLESFSVCIADLPSSAQLGQIFSPLAHSSSESLTNVHVYHPSSVIFEGHSAPHLDAHDFQPLMKFRNLKSLLIETECSISDLDDELLEAMGTSWPKLNHLWLTNGWGESSASQCTLRGILYLGQHCPDLTSLRIVFQASAKISWNGRPSGGVVNEHLACLEVARSPITDPCAVASFLSDVFPRLTSIVGWPSSNDSNPIELQYSKRWQETVRLYHAFVAIRNEERAWAVSVGKIERDM